MKDHEGICGKYEGICQYIGFGTPISIWALGLGKISNSPLAEQNGTKLEQN